MLKSCAEDEHESQAIPKRHCFAEHACKRGGRLRMDAVAQLVQLWMNEGSHGELVTHHESGNSGSRYVIGNAHSVYWMRRNCPAHRKMRVPKGAFKNGTHGFRHEIQG